MNFFIKQNSTFPKLKYTVEFWQLKKYDITDDMMQNVAVTFSMVDAETGNYRIANKEASLEITKNEYEFLDNCTYNLVYKFTLNDTKKDGLFLGEFKLDFLGDFCGKITFPIDDKINIFISDSITKTTVI